jgi:hypothetical protein
MAVVAPRGSAAAELIELTHVDGQLTVHATHEDAQAALADGDQPPAVQDRPAAP